MSIGKRGWPGLRWALAAVLAAALGMAAPLAPGFQVWAQGQGEKGREPEAVKPKAKGKSAAKAIDDETKEEKDMSSKKAKKAKKAAPARTGGHTIRSKPLED
jgi:hypothetical protein